MPTLADAPLPAAASEGLAAYPETPAERDRWIRSRRPERPSPDLWRAHSAFLESEPDGLGREVGVWTLLLASRECPWQCLMCDLWKFTTEEPIPVGAIPAQITAALPSLARNDGVAVPSPRWIKLYNSGSFFDPRAVPPADYPAIAEAVCRFERVIVECHPALVGSRCVEFCECLAEAAQRRGRKAPVLEVAMGLETAHPQVLERLNKRMTLDLFMEAAAFLGQIKAALRVFILVKPPFLAEAEALVWAKRSLEFAFDCGAAVATLIPTRFGNGALEALAARGEFSPPDLATLEAAFEYGLGLGRGRVLADLWNLDRLAKDAVDFPARAERLRRMNLMQSVLPTAKEGLFRASLSR